MNIAQTETLGAIGKTKTFGFDIRALILLKWNLLYNVDMRETVPSIDRSDDLRPYEEIDHLQILKRGKGLSGWIRKFRDAFLNGMWETTQAIHGKILRISPHKNLKITLVFYPDDPRQHNSAIIYQILDGIRDIIAPITHTRTVVRSGEHPKISTSIVQDPKTYLSWMIERHLHSYLRSLQAELGLKEIAILEIQ